MEENNLKPLTITYVIVKNLGNFETVRFGIEYELNGTPPAEAFRQAEIEVNHLNEEMGICYQTANVIN